MALPVESHRAYHRARANPRVALEELNIDGNNPPGSPRAQCTKGSRWLGFAFSKADVGKNISAQNGTIYVGGVLRTDIDPAYSGNGLSSPGAACTEDSPPQDMRRRQTCSSHASACRKSTFFASVSACPQTCYNIGWGYDGKDCSGSLSSWDIFGYICGVDESVAGWVGWSTSSSCTKASMKTSQGMQNPLIWFADESTIPKTTMTFSELRPGVMLLSQTSSSCNLGNFMRYDGKVFMHDSRLELLPNTLAKPAAVPVAAAVDACPTAPKTFLNEKYCKLQSTCTLLHLKKAVFVLNSTSLQTFYTVAGKYVYEIVGLTQAASPCGTTSRWKRLDCTAVSCNATSLSTTDTSVIVAALQLSGGWLRDITVSCSSVAAEATVQVGEEFFSHVHTHEHNVYDFSKWVDNHPGGKDKITQWVNHGFKLSFPASHPMTRWTAGTTQNKVFLLGRVGDQVDFTTLPTDLQTKDLANAFSSAGSTSYFEACGSPNEVANDPSLGNELSYWYIYKGTSNKHWDHEIDKPYADYGVGALPSGQIKERVPARFSKTRVWTMKALYAKDQLRQRTAWALSQIFVAAQPGYKYDWQCEIWVNYYDIFVRNAFKNFRDILREVTYSPLMGDYLTFKKNTAYDSNMNYPDENYAREVMQLFTIGLFKLHPNGSKVLDAQGNAVPTYSNEHVTNFARVFTGFDGQLARGNIESMKGSHNLIDPMRMREQWHDIYPKTDLDGNYIGDGYPLCSDIPPRAFLLKGANYSFLGYVYSGSYIKELNQNSALYKSLCASSGSCSFASKMQLTSNLTCYNEECNMDMVEVVKVGDGYFEYMPPTCVHLHFFNGQVSITANKHWSKWRQKCENREMQAAGTTCCGATEVRVCGQPSERVRYSVAQATCASLGLTICNKKIAAASCGYDSMQVWTPKTCILSLEIDKFGKITPVGSSEVLLSNTRRNTFPVVWLNGFPSVLACPSGCTQGSGKCTCTAVEASTKVFSYVPSKAEIKANLSIAAFAPTTACTSCSGDVKSYLASSGVIDESTVFESDGRYYKNMQSVITVGGYEFRNPPAFMYGSYPPATYYSSSFLKPRPALAEIEALLDHLFQHPNTAVFFSYRMIQRFGNSNPSATYIGDVAEAFRTGKYNGITYSGQYGDLAATVSSILLHPESRTPQSTTHGSLREPIIKLVHFLRTMEFVDANHSSLVMYNLEDVVGQEPFKSSSVFNFYQPEYQPSSFTGGLVAPEFQIFTAPFAVNLLNGFLSMIDYGGVSACNKGVGFSFDQSNFLSSYCQVGQFQLQEKSNVDDTISELNLLLTGGRLTSINQTKLSYETAAVGDQFKAVQRAIVLSPEFHTIGNPLPAGTRSATPAPAPSPASSYKATVMLFMHGGADTFNMLVPYEGALWSEYKAVRKDIALASHELLEITTTGQNISKFAVHKKLPFLVQLYKEGHAAFVSNIGPLVEPTTKAQYINKGAKNCVGLFSHSDQQTAAATLKCQIAGSSPKGVGGRMSDALKARNYNTVSFSIAGTSSWSEGFNTNQQIIHPNEGPVRLKTYSTVAPLLKNITNGKHQNVYCEEYAKSISNFVESSEILGTTLDGTTLQTSYKTDDNFQKQFHQVSRLIAARGARKVERDLFYVTIGGFDAHSNSAEVLDEKFTIINAALQGFVTELKAQNIFDSVVIASESDFGRTLSTNGAGTDHAWAGNHFVIGGEINGGKVFNQFPSSLLEGSEQDIGRLRLIPKYPWENMMVPIAEWMGMEESDFSTVFPNLANFDRAQHILANSTLFKA